MGWPQYTVAGLMIFGVFIHFAKDGELEVETYNGLRQTAYASITAWLLWMGGFWS